MARLAGLNSLRHDLATQNGSSGMHDGDFGPRVFARDIDVTTQLRGKRLNNAGPKARFGIGGARRKTNTIVIHCTSICH